jgi:hypothetical protein
MQSSEDEKKPKKKRAHDSSSDGENECRPATKLTKKTTTNDDNSANVIDDIVVDEKPSRDSFCWPDLSEWCKLDPLFDEIVYSAFGVPPQKYSTHCDHFYWKSFHIYPVRHWGTSERQLDRLATCTYDKVGR